MVRRRLLMAAATLALGAPLALVGGWPDPGASFDLLTGRSVTATTEAALVTLLCWLAVVLLALTAARTFRPARPRPTSRPHLWSLAVLVIGVALLSAGVARHTGYRVCCATPATAQQAEQLVH